ncbi:unnamed protein product [Durusdinium trenchii]|uniref:Plastid lipid-associated protein/fibrillin conserved domain-containing protein n=1 Tax=Durusdinium trenchii TaxID=1381693 RepID=A0ABP0RI29_9DINO
MASMPAEELSPEQKAGGQDTEGQVADNDLLGGNRFPSASFCPHPHPLRKPPSKSGWQDELLCTYAALVLHDDGAEITPQAMTNLIKAAGCSVEAYWPLLMAKMIKNVGMETLIKRGGSAAVLAAAAGAVAVALPRAAVAVAAAAAVALLRRRRRRCRRPTGEEERPKRRGAEPVVQAAAAAAGTAAARKEVRLRLLSAAAATCRGQCGSDVAKEGALQLVKAMEALNPTLEPAKQQGFLEGTWRLIYASEDVTRSSPFFWGWRQMLQGVPDPSPVTRSLLGTQELSESIFAITDGIPLKTVGEATQTMVNGKMVNRVAIEVFGAGRTIMTTTSRYEASPDGSELLLTVETTQAVDNTLPFADQVVFPSESFLGENARVRVRVTYLDDDLRVFRNEKDDQVFVYIKA